MLIVCVKTNTHTSDLVLLCGCGHEMHLRHSVLSLDSPALILTGGCCCWDSILSASEPHPPTAVISE